MAKDKTSDTESVQDTTISTPETDLSVTDATNAHSPEGDQAQLDARTDNSGEAAPLHPVLGNPSNPATEPQPEVDGITNSVPQNAAQVGSATDLNAFRQELEDVRADAHNAIEEIYSKATAYVDRFQNQP